ncbi:MAG: BatA domain-containing protein [Acidobacteria bacterium]|nr:BatA domain-containing protein [Acidobacteriota bacterium]
MSFLYPAFLIGVLAAAVPIVLHLFRREADVRLPFSAVRLLRRAPVEVARRRRLRELILLALRVGALALLALSFARPFFVGGAAAVTAPLTLVAVDTSYSLTAPGQFERALELARRAITNAPSSHLVALMSFDDEVRIVAAPDAARGTALAKLDAMRPEYGRTRYRAALSRAAEAFGSRPGKLVIVTDLQQVGWDGGDTVTFGSGVDVDVADVGPPAGNLAIAALRAEQNRAVAVIRNTGRLQQDGQARLEIDGRQVGALPFTIGPGRSATLRFEAGLPASGVARATVDDAHGYVADNVRYLVLDPPKTPMVLAVTGTSTARSDAFYLDRALQVDDQSRFRLETVTASTVARLDPTTLGKYSAAFLLGSQGLDLRGAEQLAGFVKAGGGLFVATGPQFDATLTQALFGGVAFPAGSEVRKARTEAVTFVPVNAHHPILRPFGPLMSTLSDVRFRQTAALPERDGWRVVARFSDGKPALVETKLGEGRILLFGSDLSNRGNDFPLHPGFVPVMHETARYLGAQDERAADLVPAELPAGMPRAPGVVELPVGKRAATATARPEPRRVAVNVDISESETARLDAKQFAAAISRSRASAREVARNEARQVEEQQHLWQYGLILMMAALVAEVAVGRTMV